MWGSGSYPSPSGHEVKKRHGKGMAFEAAADDLLRNLGPYKTLKGHPGLYWTVQGSDCRRSYKAMTQENDPTSKVVR